jgi:hypothetical protein
VRRGDHSDHTYLAAVSTTKASADLSYDKMTGADVGAVKMPDKQTGSPMTYVINGKQ